MSETRIPCEQEKGAILILLALLAVAIITFAALVIDLGAYGNERQQAQHYADLSALAALEAHFAANDASLSAPTAVFDIRDRVQAAVNRAGSVSQTNVLLSARSQGAKVHNPVLNVGGAGAELIPGRWWGAAPPGSDPCAGVYPCFRQVDITAVPEPQVTAYQVRGKIFEKFSTKLARFFFGIDSFPVNVLATASVVPRRGCFIIDMSASVTRDTHVRRAPPTEPLANQNLTPTSGRGSEFAFMLSTAAENPGENPFQNDAWDTIASGGNARTRPTNNAEWEAFFNWADEDGLQIANVTQRQFSRMHFVNDYVRKFVMMDDDYADLKTNYEADYDEVIYPFPHPDVTQNSQYEISLNNALDYRHSIRIDAYRKPDPTTYPAGKTYNGAEPLKAIFNGLNSAMNYMADRRVAGDEACLIFVDSRIWYTRFVTMTANFEYLKKLTDFSVPPGGLLNDPPGQANAANLVTSSTTGLELIVRHGLLPLGQGASKTNLALAATEAVTQLQQGNAANFASNFITIITDGLSNCRPCQAGDPCLDQGFDCNNDYSHYSSAMSNLISFANGLRGRNISINFIMTGDAVGPHTLDVAKDASGECMTDEELRLANLPYVNGGWDSSFFPNISAAFQGMSAARPFYEANNVPYQIAVGTQGLMGQIRPTPASPCTPHVCTGDRTANPSTWTRITEDPFCRTADQQMTAFMERIIGDNPFTLVDVRSSA